MHALARRGTEPALSAVYGALGGDLAAVLPEVVARHDDWLAAWIQRVPQTNEVARAGVLWPGLMEIARRFGPDMELLELGASAGLNLNLDRFAYDLGGAKAGDPVSPVQIAPEWSGPPPALSPVNIVSRIGVDCDPVDLTDPAEVERLTAFVWAGMTDRMARLEGALALAKAHPPHVEKADLVDWLAARLALPQAAGVTRVVFHSIVFQYIPEASRVQVEELLAEAGERATRERPLARLQMEMLAFGEAPELRLQTWPGDVAHELLARVHPHGTKIGWVG